MKKFVVSALVLTFAATAGTVPAEAGGLFGKKGVFRGSVGNFLDRTVEKPITTPMARALTVHVASEGGELVGGLVGQPAVGAAVGAAAGRAINHYASGRRSGFREAMMY